MSTQSQALDETLPPKPQDTVKTTPVAASWAGDHPVNIRLSLPFFGERYYFTLVAGKERRSDERLADEKAKHPLATRGNILVLAGLGTVTGLAFWTLIQFLSVLMLRDLGMVVGG